MDDGKSYLVIGAGGIGPAIAWWLLQQSDTNEVRLADKDGHRAQAAVARIASRKDIEHARCGWMYLDVSDTDGKQLVAIFAGFDVVISAVLARYSTYLAPLAIQAGTHFCDLGGVLSVTQRMQSDLNESATSAGVAIVPDCGLMPGLGNMAAQHLLNELGDVSDITIYVGGIPQRPEPPTYYQRIFSLEGLLHILEPAPVVRKGKICIIDALQEQEKLWVPELGRFGPQFGGIVEAFITAGAGTAPWWFHKQGVTNFCEKTVRWPGFAKLVKDTPHKELTGLFERTLPPTDRDHPDLVYMDVVARCGDGRVGHYMLLDVYNTEHDFSAMARTTGFSAAVIAQAMAQGLVQPGVHAPEQLPAAVISNCLKTLSKSFKQ